MIGEHAFGKGPHDRSTPPIFRAGHQLVNWRKDDVASCPRCGRGKRVNVVCHHNGRFSYPTEENQQTQPIN